LRPEYFADHPPARHVPASRARDGEAHEQKDRESSWSHGSLLVSEAGPSYTSQQNLYGGAGAASGLRAPYAALEFCEEGETSRGRDHPAEEIVKGAVLPDRGEFLVGVIQELVPGARVVITLPSGGA
jgi:hypothetical protein